jgi:hypothetical protein
MWLVFKNADIAGSLPGTESTHIVDSGSVSSILIPAGVGLEGAHFSRSGLNLVIEAPDGAAAVVRDFFAADPAPQLLFDGGDKHISGPLASRLAGSETPGQYA